MTKIIAEGIYIGVPLQVTCYKKGKEIVVDFNGDKNEEIETEFKRMLKRCYAIGGTYFPPVDSMLNVVNVLKHRFFDSRPTMIKVDGELEPIPYEDGVIY